MARKKKVKTGPSSKADQRVKESQPFNPALAGLGKLYKKTSKKQAVKPPPPPPEAEESPPQDETSAFLSAMSGVRPLAPDKGRQIPREAPPGSPPLDLAVSEDLEVMAELADLVSGMGSFDLRFLDEYMEGSQPGVGPELMERLASGSFPIQDYLDLHGFSQEEALPAVEAFLTACGTRGLRHVLLVHGRGAGSPDGIPILKTALARALDTKRLQKKVLAFCSALARDGGVGATYVLLRKWQGPWG